MDDNLFHQAKSKVEKLTNNVKTNLLPVSSDVERKFVVDESDFLTLSTLALRFLHQIEDNKKNSAAIGVEKPNETKTKISETRESENIENKNTSPEQFGGGFSEMAFDLSNGDCFEENQSEKLKQEITRVLNDKIFKPDAKTFILLDMFRRYKTNAALAKQNILQLQEKHKNPNKLVGGGTVKEECEKNNGDIVVDTADNKQRSVSSDADTLENSKLDQSVPDGNSLPIEPEKWLGKALRTVKSCMNDRINVLYLDNAKYHTNKLIQFFRTKGSKGNEGNVIYSPNKDFYLKKKFLFLKHKGIRSAFDLTKLIACLSFTKAKIFKFLQLQHKRVTPFTANEKQFLKQFLKKFPINQNRVPCDDIKKLQN